MLYLKMRANCYFSSSSNVHDRSTFWLVHITLSCVWWFAIQHQSHQASLIPHAISVYYSYLHIKWSGLDGCILDCCPWWFNWVHIYCTDVQSTSGCIYIVLDYWCNQLVAPIGAEMVVAYWIAILLLVVLRHVWRLLWLFYYLTKINWKDLII